MDGKYMSSLHWDLLEHHPMSMTRRHESMVFLTLKQTNQESRVSALAKTGQSCTVPVTHHHAEGACRRASSSVPKRGALLQDMHQVAPELNLECGMLFFSHSPLGVKAPLPHCHHNIE